MLRKTLVFILLFTMLGCVIDDRDPETLTIELNPGIDTVEVNSSYTDSGAKAFVEGETHDVKIIKNTVDITKVGTYEIIYQTSFKTKTLEITRYVDVIDETPPNVTLNPGIDTITVKSIWTDAGVVVSDNSLLEVQIEIQGEVITDQIGEYQITYIVTDLYGNETRVTRFVSVINE